MYLALARARCFFFFAFSFLFFFYASMNCRIFHLPMSFEGEYPATSSEEKFFSTFLSWFHLPFQEFRLPAIHSISLLLEGPWVLCNIPGQLLTTLFPGLPVPPLRITRCRQHRALLHLPVFGGLPALDLSGTPSPQRVLTCKNLPWVLLCQCFPWLFPGFPGCQQPPPQLESTSLMLCHQKGKRSAGSLLPVWPQTCDYGRDYSLMSLDTRRMQWFPPHKPEAVGSCCLKWLLRDSARPRCSLPICYGSQFLEERYELTA